MFSGCWIVASEASSMAPKCIASARLRRAPRDVEPAYACGIGGAVLLVVVADVPERAVIGRIHRQRRVVLPAERRGLRSLAVRENRLAKGELALGIVRKPGSESLTRVVRRAAERVANADVALPIHADARHPSIETVRRERALLIEDR